MALRPPLFVVLCLVASCGNKSDKATPDKEAPVASPPAATATPATPPTPARLPDREIAAGMIAAMTALSDRMCACVDKTCADAVAADVANFPHDMTKKYGDRPDVEPTPDETAKLDALGQRYGECQAKLNLAK
ncbi:MAG: hypothetical protein H0T42_05505 [Deltaproteobacteria bacterium]|nr:hypothetical protein [Deltaproteobacteria bacterium]